MKQRLILSVSSLMIAIAVLLGGCVNQTQRSAGMDRSLSSEEVVQFLHSFEALAEKEDFNLIRHMIHEKAYFRFNDGDFRGREAIQAVFEKTWRGDPSVQKARFYLSDIVVLTTDSNTATATYTYNWEGSQGDKQFRIQGRGTRVLVNVNGQCKSFTSI